MAGLHGDKMALVAEASRLRLEADALREQEGAWQRQAREGARGAEVEAAEVLEQGHPPFLYLGWCRSKRRGGSM
jgi:hypothetical protein